MTLSANQKSSLSASSSSSSGGETTETAPPRKCDPPATIITAEQHTQMNADRMVSLEHQAQAMDAEVRAKQAQYDDVVAELEALQAIQAVDDDCTEEEQHRTDGLIEVVDAKRRELATWLNSRHQVHEELKMRRDAHDAEKERRYWASLSLMSRMEIWCFRAVRRGEARLVQAWHSSMMLRFGVGVYGAFVLMVLLSMLHTNHLEEHMRANFDEDAGEVRQLIEALQQDRRRLDDAIRATRIQVYNRHRELERNSNIGFDRAHVSHMLSMRAQVERTEQEVNTLVAEGKDVAQRLDRMETRVETGDLFAQQLETRMEKAKEHADDVMHPNFAVCINLLHGKSFWVEISLRDNVGTLKRRIEEHPHARIPAGQQRLTFNGKQLDDDEVSLSKLGMCPGHRDLFCHRQLQRVNNFRFASGSQVLLAPKDDADLRMRVQVMMTWPHDKLERAVRAMDKETATKTWVTLHNLMLEPSSEQTSNRIIHRRFERMLLRVHPDAV